MEPSKPVRHLTVIDLALIVVAAGVGLGMLRLMLRSVFNGWLDYSRWSEWLAQLQPRFVLYMLSDATAPLIVVATAGTGILLVLRHMPPRPSRRRIARQSGMAACIVASLSLAWVAMAYLLFELMLSGFPGYQFDRIRMVQTLIIHLVFPLVGVSVMTTWVQNALAGRWRRPADWIDLAGIVVGIFWIVIGFAWTLRSYELLI
jgi:hypothetical protein